MEQSEKENKGFLKRRGKQFQIGKLGNFIVMQTENGFTKLTKTITLWNIIGK